MKNTSKSIINAVINIIAFYFISVLILEIYSRFPAYQYIIMTKSACIGAIIYCAVRNFRSFSLKELSLSGAELLKLFIAHISLNIIAEFLHRWMMGILPAGITMINPILYNSTQFCFYSFSTFYNMACVGAWYFIIRKFFFKKSPETAE